MKRLTNMRGFTLIEMLIVMLVISILLLLIIPNVTKHRESMNDKGCAALVSIVQAQADAYYLEEKTVVDSIQPLLDKGYLEVQQTSCEGKEITINEGKAINPIEEK